MYSIIYRLTQLAQTIKSRISHPDCCCGYTLDQAASLEGEIKRWQSALPHSLKGPSEDAGHTSPFQWDDNVEIDRAAQAQSYELATMANFLVLKVYTPFLRHPTSEGGPSSMSHETSASGSAVSMNSPASQSSIHAAQAIIRVAKALQSSLSTTTTNILPAMFDFYPLDKVVFDSVVICAHAAFTGKASTLLLDGGALADDVGSGLNVLSGLPSSASGSVADAQKKITEALFKRLISRGMNVNTGSGTKRKHDQVDMGTYSERIIYPFLKFPADIKPQPLRRTMVHRVMELLVVAMGRTSWLDSTSKALATAKAVLSSIMGFRLPSSSTPIWWTFHRPLPPLLPSLPLIKSRQEIRRKRKTHRRRIRRATRNILDTPQLAFVSAPARTYGRLWAVHLYHPRS